MLAHAVGAEYHGPEEDMFWKLYQVEMWKIPMFAETGPMSLNILSVWNHLKGLLNFSLSVDMFLIYRADVNRPATDSVCREEHSVFTKPKPTCLLAANHSDCGNFLSRKIWGWMRGF